MLLSAHQWFRSGFRFLPSVADSCSKILFVVIYGIRCVSVGLPIQHRALLLQLACGGFCLQINHESTPTILSCAPSLESMPGAGKCIGIQVEL